jgi:hypothetical protein
MAMPVREGFVPVEWRSVECSGLEGKGEPRALVPAQGLHPSSGARSGTRDRVESSME